MHLVEVVLVCVSPLPVIKIYLSDGKLPTALVGPGESCLDVVMALANKLCLGKANCSRLAQCSLFDQVDRPGPDGRRVIGVPYLVVLPGSDGKGWVTVEQVVETGLPGDHLAILIECLNQTTRK